MLIIASRFTSTCVETNRVPEEMHCAAVTEVLLFPQRLACVCDLVDRIICQRPKVEASCAVLEPRLSLRKLFEVRGIQQNDVDREH
jgi:hypothetical protein